VVASKGVRVVRVPRLGLPAARNHAIGLVETPYIVCLDADDVLSPEHVRLGVAALQLDAGDVAAPQFECFDGAQHVVEPSQLQLPGLLLENSIAVASVFRRSAWEAVGGYCTTMSGVQDWELWIAIAASGRRITKVAATTFRYRVRAGSMYSRTKQPARFGQLVDTIIDRHHATFQQHWRQLLPQLFMRLQAANAQWAQQARVLEGQAAERTLLGYWRAEGPGLATQLEELRQWVAQLEEAKAWLARQNERLESELKRQLEERNRHPLQRVPEWRASPLSGEAVAGTDLEARCIELETALQRARAREQEALEWAKALDEAKTWHAEQSRAWREHCHRFDSTPLWRLLLQRTEARINRIRSFLGASAQRVLGLPQPPRAAEALWRVLGRLRGGLQRRPEEGAAEQVAGPPWGKDDPLVSVVIPCFNYGQYVVDAVESVLAQTFRNFEVIVVDGGSTDGSTRPQLQSLRREKTRVLLRDSRHLVGSNRNYGIEHARGRYICCLDADDRLRPQYLETALYLLERYQFDVVSTSIQQFGTADRVYGVAQRPTLEQMLEGNHIPTVAVFRKAMWEQAGGVRDFGLGREHIYEDWCFWVRLCGLGARIHNIVESPLFLYRVHSGASLSSQDGSVPSMDVQRARILEFNQDVLTPDHRQRFAANNRREILNSTAFATLANPKAAERPSGTILITMPFLTIGGAEALMSSWCAHLSRSGWRLVLVTTIPTGPELGDATSWFQPALPEIYHLPRLLPEKYWLDWYRYLIVTREVELLWQVGSPFTYEHLPTLKGEFPRLRVVDLLFNTGVHAVANRRQRQWIDRHVCENREVEAYLIGQGASPATVRVVRSGVDLQHFAPRAADPSIREVLGAGERTLVVGFLGRMSEEKAPDVFLQVANLLRDVPEVAFLMTGAGPLTAETMAKAQALRLERRFHHFGCVDDIRPYLGSCDVLLLPSRFDGRPTVVLQALAMGIPVVASRVGALPEIVEDGVTGVLCEPGRAEAFANALQGLLADRDRLAVMKRAARAYAQKELDHQTACRGIEGVFVDLQSEGDPTLHDT
jgi:glycosyltransferase involved in cell wall biosynthesis